MLEGPKGDAAFRAIEADVFQLGKDACTTGDNACDADKAVEMGLPELAESVVDWEVGDSDVDL